MDILIYFYSKHVKKIFACFFIIYIKITKRACTNKLILTNFCPKKFFADIFLIQLMSCTYIFYFVANIFLHMGIKYIIFLYYLFPKKK